MHAQREAHAAASLTALATSQAFIQALKRDIHILVHSFELTWTWLDGQASSTTTASVPLRWEYGALTVFERVWTRNQWNQLAGALGNQLEARKAFYHTTVRAFLDEITQCDTGTTVLHKIGGLFGVYFVWLGQPELHNSPIGIDHAMLEQLLHLPERARAILDTDAVQDGIPPSADVWYVVNRLLGNPPSTENAALVLQFPAPAFLEADTAIMPRDTVPHSLAHGTVGIRADLIDQHAPVRAKMEDVHRSITDTLGIPLVDSQQTPTSGHSQRTAESIANLSRAQQSYIAQRDAFCNNANPILDPESGSQDLVSTIAKLTDSLGE
ncbi:hypothetical protein MYAM1_003688 [Malassezia yamatoensis]|uniref:Uncharacterized protein n=1 Tax=Malassezia yamatoensis TaxID=253288 RepID=A0AAJ6CKN9_9BASI|nr:hypothetical protein MYAM1_003688 [Malassezia yamatoensis]